MEFFLQHIPRYNTIKKLQREEIVEWIISHPNVNPSFVLSDVVTFLNPISNQKDVFPKHLMEISIRDIKNDTTKPSEDGGLESVGDYVTQKVPINGTTLRSFIPPQVRKITPRLRQICGCELFIITKDMQIDLNIFRTRLVTDLHYKSVGIHKHNSLFSIKSAAHYNDKVFQYIEFFK